MANIIPNRVPKDEIEPQGIVFCFRQIRTKCAIITFCHIPIVIMKIFFQSGTGFLKPIKPYRKQVVYGVDTYVDATENNNLSNLLKIPFQKRAIYRRNAC